MKTVEILEFFGNPGKIRKSYQRGKVGTLPALCMSVDISCSVGDPGFPVGGGGTCGTSDVSVFRQKCMPKRKNWVPYGGRAPDTPPRSANDV